MHFVSKKKGIDIYRIDWYRFEKYDIDAMFNYSQSLLLYYIGWRMSIYYFRRYHYYD
jgi:hypothetical protein